MHIRGRRELTLAAEVGRSSHSQDTDRDRAGDGWIDTGLIFTTRHGTPIEPRNFGRSLDRCIIAARVPRITVHGTRKDLRFAAGHARRPPASRDAHSAVEQYRRHDGDLYRSTIRCYPVTRSASSATGLHDRCCRLLLPED